MRTVTAADFKATCLRLMDEVSARRERITITKHGKPVAQLVPIDSPSLDDVLGGGRGSAIIHGDLVPPVAETDEWESSR